MDNILFSQGSILIQGNENEEKLAAFTQDIRPDNQYLVGYPVSCLTKAGYSAAGNLANLIIKTKRFQCLIFSKNIEKRTMCGPQK